MKKITIAAILVAALMSSACAYAQNGFRDDFEPASINGPFISFHTDKKVGSEIRLAVTSTGYNSWIDLNGNKVYDPGERIKEGRMPSSFVINTQDLVIYGDVTEITNAYNEVTSVDISRCTDLKAFRFHGNKLSKLDLSQNVSLSIVGCSYNNISVLDFSNNPNIRVVSLALNNVSKENMLKMARQLKSRVGKMYGYLIVTNSKYSEPDRNVCTKEVVQILKEKNFKAQDQNSTNPDDYENVIDYEGIDDTHVEFVENYSDIDIDCNQGVYTVTFAKPCQGVLSIYDAGGARIKDVHIDGLTCSFDLGSQIPGVYILKVGNRSIKINKM